MVPSKMHRPSLQFRCPPQALKRPDRHALLLTPIAP
jgi:hypothetical protein